MTIEELKKLRLVNRANKTIYSLIGLIIGEYQNKLKGSNPEQADLINIMSKLYTSNNEVISLSSNPNPALLEENEFIKKFLPTKLTTEELSSIIYSYGPKNIGDAMKFLSSKYKGQFDGKEAKTVVEAYLRGAQDE